VRKGWDIAILSLVFGSLGGIIGFWILIMITMRLYLAVLIDGCLIFSLGGFWRGIGSMRWILGIIGL
jgi:hypothetical protein